MKKPVYGVLSLFLVILSISIGYVYASQEFDRVVLINETINEDLYAAGEAVRVSAPVHGDITAAAQRISIDETVDGDLNLAAEIITVSAPVKDDIRAAGRLINITAPVGDHIVAAGETITISTKASIQGWAKLAGRQVEILGNIGKDLTVAGQHVIIGGTIQGLTEITADTITILSSAHLKGKLIYRSDNKPDIQSGAIIDGAIEQLPIPSSEGVAKAAVTAVIGVILVFGLALITTGIVYSLAFPEFNLGNVRRLTDQPLPSIGLGVAVLIVTPIIIMLLMMTVIGYLLALCLLAVYLLTLLLGILTGVFYIAEFGLQRIFKVAEASKGKRIFAFIAAAIVLAILLLIPILGALLFLFLLIGGIGALHLQLWRQYQHE